MRLFLVTWHCQMSLSLRHRDDIYVGHISYTDSLNLVSLLQRSNSTWRLTIQVSSLNWLLGIIKTSWYLFLEIVLPPKRKLNPLKSFKYHKHQYRGNKVWTVFRLFARSQSLQLSLFSTQVTIYPSYFFITSHECLFHCFSLHVDANSLDVTEKL